ncbi:acyltransferase family protein [Komagataeibacter sucrofermentans]|uniref:Acyltransferase n=1 Tax=Komagataeibacter sucrofermentans TaxID=1053551 RepID=A0A318QL45_9PROT|nr:acyltransferase [Komagataeibacter sucrofermentans]PYD79140.1 acyltransferase [Komagataeibacter sucrofermentans]GBQ45389.1 lipopolysaccharide modification acyltransferase [Komagataeibacter sucrofermentans DSM 15973]
MSSVTETSGTERHYLHQLTSLRGVACLVVLFGHAIQVFHYNNPQRTPVQAGVHDLITYAFNAEAAVVLFFVLSGCVLSLSLRKYAHMTARIVGSFYIKRIFRIYPLLWFSIGLAVLSMVVARGLVPDGVFVGWLSRNLHTPVSIRNTIASLAGVFTRYNGPMWSLRVELMYSVVFPLLFVLMRGRTARVVTLLALAVIALLPVPHEVGTVFALSFGLGALIPLLPGTLGKYHGLYALVALIVLLYDRYALAGLHLPERIADMIDTLAAFVVIRDLYASGRQYRILLSRPVIVVGELSYGIYLMHLPVMLIVFTIAGHRMGTATLLAHPSMTQFTLGVVTAVLTTALAGFTYRVLELPLHNIGRRLGRSILDVAPARPLPTTQDADTHASRI